MESQSLPLLILGEGKQSKHQTGVWQGRSFISDKNAILEYLADEMEFRKFTLKIVRYGPRVHMSVLNWLVLASLIPFLTGTERREMVRQTSR